MNICTLAMVIDLCRFHFLPLKTCIFRPRRVDKRFLLSLIICTYVQRSTDDDYFGCPQAGSAASSHSPHVLPGSHAAVPDRHSDRLFPPLCLPDAQRGPGARTGEDLHRESLRAAGRTGVQADPTIQPPLRSGLRAATGMHRV